jgi:hypothetical protein
VRVYDCVAPTSLKELRLSLEIFTSLRADFRSESVPPQGEPEHHSYGIGARFLQGSVTEPTKRHRRRRRLDWKKVKHILEPRAVSRRVAEARPYIPYDRGDLAAVYGDGRWATVPAKQRGPVFTRAANLEPGLIIAKHPVPGCSKPVLPQMRPDREVRVHLNREGRQGHDHADLSQFTRMAHVTGKSHEGEEVGDLHSHVSDGMAKYLLTPKPITEWEVRHEHSVHTPDNHIVHKHGKKPGTIIRGEHVHTTRGKDGRDSPEKRLDMNPLAALLLPDARQVFFSIEGSIKADALLSKGTCAFAVPSVTMWSALELDEFARKHLAGKVVYVVPDQDWVDNPMVSTQAFLCTDYFKQRGVEAYVAASPGPEKGVDDFLAGGGRVQDLFTQDRALPQTFDYWRRDTMRDPRYGDVRGRARAVDVTRLLSMLSNGDGLVVKPGRDLCKYVGFSYKRLHGMVEYLREWDWDDDPPFRVAGDWLIDTRWWHETPVFEIREDLRPTTRSGPTITTR